MRIAIWNIGHWERSVDQRETAWRVLADEIAADVALLQEVVPPVDRDWHTVYRPFGGARPWGTAVVGLTTEVEELTHAQGRYNTQPAALDVAWPGSVVVATVTDGAVPLTVMSLYGLIDDGYADTTVNRQLSDLTPLLDDPDHECRVLLGGDLNITTQWIDAQARYRDWDGATLARIKGFGLVDLLDQHREGGPLDGCGCLDGDACRHVHTQRHGRSPRPWQNDYAFASPTVASMTSVCAIHDSPAVQELGGHMPIVVDVTPG